MVGWMIMNSENTVIVSIDQLIDEVSKDPDDARERFYRGVNFEHGIEKDLPKLARDNYRNIQKAEDEIIKEALIYRPFDFENCRNTIEVLELMQHYGFPTRLLDITHNPLVALYFACAGEKNKDNNGQIIIYDISKDNVKYSDSDTVSVLANFAYMPSDFNLKFYVQYPKKAVEKYYNYEKLIHQIRAEKAYFTPSIKPEHLDGYVVCVKPRINNPRIAAQEGAFLLFGDKYNTVNTKVYFETGVLGRSFTRLNEKRNMGAINWRRIIIPREKKKDFLRQLEIISINEQKLFPELDIFAKKYNRTNNK